MEGFPWGGSEELWYRVAKYSIKQGDRVYVSVKFWDNLHPKVNQLKSIDCVFYFRKFRHQSFLKKKIKKLLHLSNESPWDFIKKNDFNHILLNFGWAYDIISHRDLYQLLHQLNIPYSILQQFNYDNYYLNDEERLLARNFFLRAQNVFFVSKRNAQTTERNLVCTITNQFVISNPANIIRLDENISFPDTTIISFACVARFDIGIKNQDLLIEAFANVNWKYRNFRLNFYGKGNGEYYLKELVKKFNLENRVYFKGHLDNIQDIWSENHVMILSSSAEGSPLSIIEAMYCARPIVATDVAGIKELIDDTCGFVIPGINLYSVTTTLEEVWERRNELEQMGINARKKIISEHNPASDVLIYDIITSK